MKRWKIYYAMNPKNKSKKFFKVGCTKNDLLHRCYKIQGYRQYGLIEEVHTIEDADKREMYWQKIYDCLDCNTPYSHIYRKGRYVRKNKHKEIARQNLKKACELNKRPVLQLDRQNNLIKVWPSALEAGMTLFGNKGASITVCCKGGYHTSKGFKWKYATNVCR